MEDLLIYINNEWKTLKEAPFSFILLLIIAFIAAYIISRWRYESIVSTLKERIESFKDRLNSKDEQLNDYRERLKLQPATDTSYSNLSNSELKNITLQKVNGIREFINQRQANDYENIFSRFDNFDKMNKEEKQKKWQEDNKKMSLQSLETNSQYDMKFKVDTILLRDEILTRLPKDIKRNREFEMYEHPTNILGIKMVVDDLERIAKSLP